jgi:hypothetical protein
MIKHEREGQITAATDKLRMADQRLASLLAELESLPRAEKTYVTSVIRAALDDVAAAREVLRQLVDHG